MKTWNRFGPVGWGAIIGVVAAVVALLWITLDLLMGAGATAKVLYVALLFLLPVLSLGALAGWLAGLVVAAFTSRTGAAER